MDKEALLQARKDTETRFNELSQQRQEIDDELKKLQGRWDTYGELLAKLEEAEQAKEPVEGEVVDNAPDTDSAN